MSMPGLGERAVRVAAWGRTDPGCRRSENQDTFLILELREGEHDPGFRLGPAGTPPGGMSRREFTLGPTGVLLLVADGMGGAAGGSVASSTAAERIAESMSRRWLPERERDPRRFAGHLVRTLEEANRELHSIATQRPELEGMGTTATLVGILGDRMYLAQVGDSRAYLIRNGSARQLTRDQSVTQALVDAGALTEEEVERSPQKNVILQALGTGPTVSVDLTHQQVRRGDTVVVCSDGLTAVVRADELAAAAARFMDPPALCEALLETANSRGSPDNVTVVVARLEGPGLEEPRAEDQVGRQVYPTDGP